MSVSARRAATRDRVMAAAVEVFADRGVQAASVEEICEKAGFTRGAFYSNFDSKVDLCSHILDAQSARTTVAAQHAVAAVDDGSTDPDELVATAVKAFLDTMDSSADTVLTLSEMRVWAAREPDLAAAFERMNEAVMPFFDTLLTEGVARHGYRLTMSVADVINLLRAVHDDSLLQQLRGDSLGDRSETVRLMSAVLRALMVPVD